MDFRTLFGTCVRQWKVVLVVGIATTLGGVWSVRSVEPTYTAKASILVVGPSLDGSNPLGELNSSITTTTVALQRALSGPKVRSMLGERGLSTEFSVDVVGRGSEPILDINAESGDPETALKTVAAISDAASSELTRRQDALDVALDRRITTQVLSADNEATREQAAQMRSLILAVLLALGLTVASAVIVDHRQASRRWKKAQRQSQQPPGPAPEVTTTDGVWVDEANATTGGPIWTEPTEQNGIWA